MNEAREIYEAAKARWLAQPGNSYAGLHGILIGVVAAEYPHLLIEAAGHADRLVSVDKIVEESLGVES